jgi:hypothetical protein
VKLEPLFASIIVLLFCHGARGQEAKTIDVFAGYSFTRVNTSSVSGLELFLHRVESFRFLTRPPAGSRPLQISESPRPAIITVTLSVYRPMARRQPICLGRGSLLCSGGASHRLLKLSLGSRMQLVVCTIHRPRKSHLPGQQEAGSTTE